MRSFVLTLTILLSFSPKSFSQEPTLIQVMKEVIGPNYKTVAMDLKSENISAQTIDAGQKILGGLRMSMTLIPSKYQGTPSPESQKMITAYRTTLTQAIKDAEKLSKALEAKDLKAAIEACDALKKSVVAGHEHRKKDN